MPGQVRLALCSWLLSLLVQPVAVILEVPDHDCVFDRASLSFAGDDRQQALCLLRPLELYGRSGPALERLPEFLDRHVGSSIRGGQSSSEWQSPVLALEAFLERSAISQGEVGGGLLEPLSSTEAEFGPPVQARYFVLHDTSHPNLLDAPAFPADINESTWVHNQVDRWQEGENSKAHVFVGRDGSSATAVPFSRGWRATKLEVKVVGEASRGLFLHVEHVQPRRSVPEGPPGNDGIAPVPGFAPLQLERSALLYVVASVRGGRWLIPAYHHNVDAPLVGAHDDPQNFPLEDWAATVERIWLQLSTDEGAVSGSSGSEGW
jgi:hypothetical protein